MLPNIYIINFFVLTLTSIKYFLSEYLEFLQ